MQFAWILAQQGAGQTSIFDSIGPFVPLLAILFIGYFLLWRPARRQEAERRAMVSALKENDKIVNSGGIIGVVASIKEKEDEVVLKGGIRITKSSIVRVVREDSAKE
jgi:preprotein translocase subunit YajC